MKTLGVALVGFGFMGRTHTYAHKTIPIYYDPAPAQVRLAVVCDATEQLARRAQEIGGFARCTTDLREAVRADDVDVVHICTPNAAHLEGLREAMAAGKHIYVDKPVVATLAEAEELERLLKGYTGIAQVALHARFLPATIKARQIMASGALGPITHFRADYLHSGNVDPNRAVNWKSTAAGGGGVIRDLGAHVLDLLHWLIGPMASVCCVSRIWATQRPAPGRPGEKMTIDVEDAATMLLRRADGAFGTVEVSKIANGAEDELRFEIYGGDGALRFNMMQPNYLEYYDARRPDGDYGGERGWQHLATVGKYPKPTVFPNPKFAFGWVRAHVHSVYSFLATVAEGRPASPSLAEGIYLQRVLEAVRASADRAQWVDLPQA